VLNLTNRLVDDETISRNGYSPPAQMCVLSRTVKDLITWADPKQAGNGSIHNTVGKVANLLTGSLAVERVSVGTLMSE